MRTTARLRSTIRSIFLAGGLLLLAAPAVSAWSPPRLPAQLTDQAGVLGSGHGDVQSALDDLLNNENVQLWVVLIPSGEGASAPDLARQTFEINGFGGNDMVLLVAVNDHRYGWWETTATGLLGSQVDGLLSSDMEPPFRAGDYGGGLVDFIHGLAAAVDQARNPVSQPTYNFPERTPVVIAPGSTGVDSGTTTLLWTLIAIILILGGVVFIFLAVRRWRWSKLTIEERDKHTGDLARQANKLLVDTDDALRDAQQEVGFAQAEFTDDDVAPYQAAVTASQAQLKQAFAIRQQLDDSIPEDQPTKERMYGQIITLCRSAQAGIATEAKRLNDLRDLEKSAPQVLTALPDAIKMLQGREPAIKDAMKTLGEYSPSSWAPVKGNAEEADKRGHFAEQQIAAGNAALAATPPNVIAAAHAARAAQEAIAQANQLLDAVEQQAAALKKAQNSLADEIAAVEAQLAAARKTAAAAAGQTGVPATQEVAAEADLAKAESLLTTAKAQGAAAAPDTIAALKSAQTAHATADSALAGVRDAAASAARAQAAYSSARASADAAISRAEGFIAARRGSIGGTARTRLAEAERHLGVADSLAATDLAGATNEATTAESMAEQAYTIASNEFGPFGGGGRGPFDGGMFGVGMGGNRGGGFGGSPWGSAGGWSGGGSSSPGSSGGFGGFGGFGGGHGGGGGFGGGGGSSGGGHGGGGGW